jgi:prepilin-type N-terminal cleavage/methylation domain-containing protein
MLARWSACDNFYFRVLLDFPMTPTASQPRNAFTLIELLIVIAIIGILMSLLFPAVNSALDAARKAQAKNDVVQIATAITAYEAEYGKLPDNASTVSRALVRVLTGEDTNANPRKIVFLEVQASKKGKSGTNVSGNFVDPWGGTYSIALDNEGGNSSYDNTITAGGANALSSTTLRKKVAVWNTNSVTRRRVGSWE